MDRLAARCREPIDPGHKQATQRIGHRRHDVVDLFIGTIEHRSRQLFDEERNAVRS